MTPDSFSDANRYATVDAALERARRIAEEGATIIDVGGESTRPGAAPVPLSPGSRRLRVTCCWGLRWRCVAYDFRFSRGSRRSSF